MLLRRRHVAFDGGKCCSLLGVGRRVCGVGIERRDGLGVDFGVVDAGDAAPAVVATVFDNLLGAGVEGAEWVGKCGGLKAVTEHVVAVLADLIVGIGVLQLFQVRVGESMA